MEKNKERNERQMFARSFLGKTLDIMIDRPLGSVHPKYKSLTYTVNYGYIPNVFSDDGEELDVYLLGVNVPVKTYRANIIAVIYRSDDIEDKLVASPKDIIFTKEEIRQAVAFQEQYFTTEIELYDEGITKM